MKKCEKEMNAKIRKRKDDIKVVVVVVVEDFGSWVSPPSLNCSLAPCPSTLTRLSVSGGVIPAKNPIYGCLGRPERTYSKVANGAIAIGS